MSKAFAATTGVKASAAAKAPAFLNTFLRLESSTALLEAARAEAGLDMVDDEVKASEEDDMATRARAEIIR